MFFRDRETTLDGLARLGATLCGYCSGFPETWLTTRCDCKYGGPTPARPMSEQTGCPEIRSTYVVVAAMTDAEWLDIANRAGGITTARLADLAGVETVLGSTRRVYKLTDKGYEVERALNEGDDDER